jgi:hypothetical protein
MARKETRWPHRSFANGGGWDDLTKKRGAKERRTSREPTGTILHRFLFLAWNRFLRAYPPLTHRSGERPDPGAHAMMRIASPCGLGSALAQRLFNEQCRRLYAGVPWDSALGGSRPRWGADSQALIDSPQKFNPSPWVKD